MRCFYRSTIDSSDDDEEALELCKYRTLHMGNS